MLVEEDQRPPIEAQTFEVVAELAQPLRQRIASSLAPHFELEGEALAAAVRQRPAYAEVDAAAYNGADGRT